VIRFFNRTQTVSYNDSRLISQKSSQSIQYAPFVSSIQRIGRLVKKQKSWILVNSPCYEYPLL
jgi:amino acid permease